MCTISYGPYTKFKFCYINLVARDSLTGDHEVSQFTLLTSEGLLYLMIIPILVG